MRTERITSAQHPLYAQAMEVYRNSFPPHEQREAASQERILHDSPRAGAGNAYGRV